jgi:hypothetical protein
MPGTAPTRRVLRGGHLTSLAPGMGLSCRIRGVFLEGSVVRLWGICLQRRRGAGNSPRGSAGQGQIQQVGEDGSRCGVTASTEA